jgi:hypothetical protein
MIEVAFQGRTIEGLPLSWTRGQVHLLGRDGRLWQFDPQQVSDFRQTSAEFRPFGTSEFRAALLRELGGDYEVSGTGHYLVAHPRGQGGKWAQRFEDLYRSLVHYFSVRGFTPSAPSVPLVGVVCKSRDDFNRRAGLPAGIQSGVLGYYDLQSNRINLYDMGGNDDSSNWQRNAAVVIHEATHQTAFNTGIHSRYSPPPLWVAEGLATLFEAPGVYDSRANTRPADRLNRERLQVFKRVIAPRHRPEMLASIVASDDVFRVNPGAAYAEAWAMTFFLVETEPRKYVEYLQRTAARQPFAKYSSAARTAEFTAIFGSDWRMLEARLLRLIDGL